jgi:ketosteroid isomerase-like protein
MADEHEYVAIVKRCYEGLNRGDFEAATQDAHPEIEVTRVGGFPPLKGREAVMAWMAPDALQDQTAEAQEFKANDDRLFVKTSTHARGAESGLEMTVDVFQAWTFEDGKVIRIESFFDRDEALAAAGLPADS